MDYVGFFLNICVDVSYTLRMFSFRKYPFIDKYQLYQHQDQDLDKYTSGQRYGITHTLATWVYILARFWNNQRLFIKIMFKGLFFTFVGNKLMWENATRMLIVSLNWWQYAGRLWSHTNNAQPPNSHLAPKLNINEPDWNNSLHIGGTCYCPSDPYTSSVSCSRPRSAHFLAERQPTPGGQHCLVKLR